ncbi:MAG TPA: Ig domain-containing protein [Steroidobacteraceae bacterium]|nr:Ig domain-containing protein [Steroidobacteraceae bacterium]
MRFTLPGSRRTGAAATRLLLPFGAVLATAALAACSSDYNLGINPSLGIAVDVALAVSGGVTQLYQGESTIVTASVSNDPTGAGVNWKLDGPGTLIDATPTSVVYEAPPATPTFAGAESALITAISNYNATQNAAVTIVTLGTPVITPATQFPGNVNVPYATNINVVGGVTPYAWTLSSGTFPPGLTLTSATSAIATLSGTPTTAGTYDFTLQVEDSAGNYPQSPQQFEIIIKPYSPCILSGQFTLASNGFRGGGEYVHLAHIDIDASGNITGEQDYKDGNRVTLAEALTSGSKCTTRTTNSGVLTLLAPSGELDYNFSATPPDTSGAFHSARLELIAPASSTVPFEDSGSGELLLTDTTALTGTAPTGNFAFGLLGVDSQTLHYGTIGAFSVSAGTFTGSVDSNAGDSRAKAPLGADLANAPSTGTVSAPDGYGRGTVSLQAGAGATTLVYYIVNAGKYELMNADPTVGTAREFGYLTAQTGDASPTTFDSAALGSPSILSLWGRQGTVDPSAVAALGRLSGADTGAGTVNVVLDSSDQSTDTDNVPYASQAYSVAANGRGTLSLIGASTRNFVFYLDGVSNGYLLELGSSSGNSGLLELQIPPAGGFTDSLSGAFVSGTQFAMANGPITLQSLEELTFGSLSGDYQSGTFAIDSTGRGFGTVLLNGVATTADVLYIVSPTKVDLMNFGTPNGVNSSISWLIQ